MFPEPQPLPSRAAQGFVSLVGAGPGHPDFLTLKGLRRLEQAEVILADALLDPAFRALYPRAAEVVEVGKRCGRESLSQERINALLVEHGLRGRRVLRLKGGDPLIYGRGFEEAQALAAAGLPFEIIPGVSALQAGAAAAGISLTHRGLTDEIRVLEGHHLLERERDWASLAQPGPTLALFMATRQIAAIAARLLASGAPEKLPVVLVERAGWPEQSVTRSTLGFAAEGRLHPRTEGPGILYLGPAAGLRLESHVHPDDAPPALLSGSAPLPRVAGGGRPHRPGQAGPLA